MFLLGLAHEKYSECIPLRCWKHGFANTGSLFPRPDEGVLMPSIIRAARSDGSMPVT